MIKKRRKPDFMFVLAVIVGLGVIITMKAQTGAGQQTQSASVSAKPATIQIQAALK